MKKLFSILLCIGLLTVITGCGDTAQKEDTVTETENVRETVYIIDSQGEEEYMYYDALRAENPGEYDEVWLCIAYNSDGTVDYPYSIYYNFDENGNITYRGVTTGGDEFLQQYYMQYDEEGRETEYHYTNKDGAKISTVYEYTDDEHCTATRTSTVDGVDTVIASSEYVDELDENENLVKRTITDPDDGSAVITTYTYDDNGNVIESVENWDSCTYTTTYTYDKNNNVIEEIMITDNPDDSYSYRTVYAYE